MSQALFRRAWSVQVDTIDVSNLDVEFKILSTIKATPNKCVLTLWNVNQDHRSQLLKRNRPSPGVRLVGVPVQVVAGYVDNTSVLFSGDLREVGGQRDDVDRKVILSGDDGGRSFREGRINSTFTAGTAVSQVLQQCAEAMGIGLGNAANFEEGAQIAGIGSQLPHTMTLSGSAPRELTRVLDSMGLKWSVQRGALQILQNGQPLNLGAILIDSMHGLIGAPQESIDSTVSLGNPQQFAPGANQKSARKPKPKDPGIVKFRTLLIPGLVPGRKIVLNSEEFSGGYMLTEVEYEGQSWSPSTWNCNCVARVY